MLGSVNPRFCVEIRIFQMDWAQKHMLYWSNQPCERESRALLACFGPRETAKM